MEPTSRVGSDAAPPNWLVRQRRGLVALAVVLLGLLAVLGYFLLTSRDNKQYPGLLVARATPTLAPAATPTHPATAVARATPFAPAAFTPSFSTLPTPQPTTTPVLVEYDVQPDSLIASHILTVTTDAGAIQFVLFYDAAPATVRRLTTAIDGELLVNNKVERDPDYAVTYLAASKLDAAVSYERNNLPLDNGVLVEDPGEDWRDYAPISLVVVSDAGSVRTTKPLIAYGRLVGKGIPSAAQEVKAISYVICSSLEQNNPASPCSLSYNGDASR